MIRHKLVTAVVAAVVLTLSACSSTPGSATAESPASPSESSAVETTAADAGDTAADTTEDAATDTTSEDAESSDSATVTVEGDIDAQSAAWFGTVCDGVSPMLDAVFGAMGAMMGSAGGTGDDASAAKQAQATLVETFNKAADAMTAAAAKLSSLPPPTIDHGEEIATEAATGLAKAGPALKQVADGLSKATVTSMEDLSTVMQQASDAVNQDLDSLSLNNFELSDEMQAEVAKIPSCAPLMSLGDMGSTGGDAAPTS
jgi:hypothetical protein